MQRTERDQGPWRADGGGEACALLGSVACFCGCMRADVGPEQLPLAQDPASVNTQVPLEPFQSASGHG